MRCVQQRMKPAICRVMMISVSMYFISEKLLIRWLSSRLFPNLIGRIWMSLWMKRRLRHINPGI